MEQLEDRRVLAAVSWTGSGGNLLWSNPANWSTNQLPGLSDDVTINAPGNVTIVYNSSQATTVRSLSLADSLQLSAGSINVSGAISITPGNTLTVAGVGVEFAAQGTPAINGSNLLVSNGGRLSLPSLTTFAHGQAAHTLVTLRATGSGSVLDLGNLQTLTGATAINARVNIEAQAGGVIAMGALTSILDPEQGDQRGRAVNVTAEGTGSRVELANLQTFQDRSSVPWSGLDGYSSLVARNGGQIIAPSLTSLNATEIILDATGVLPINQITTLTDSRVQINGGNRDFAALTDANGASLLVSDGGQLSMPSLTTYAHGRAAHTSATLRATGSGSVLDLGNLQTLTGATVANARVNIEAQAGGVIAMGALTSILDPEQGDQRGRAVNVSAEGTGSRVELANLQTFQDRSSVPWSGLDGYSSLVARNGGQIIAPSLTSLNATEIILDATGVLPINQITTLTDSRVQINGGNRDFAALTNANGASLLVSDGGQLSMPSLTTYAHGRAGHTSATLRATGPGSVLDLGNLQTLTGATETNARVNIEAQAGGVIAMGALTSILDPEQGDQRGRAVNVTAEGTGSRVELANLQTFQDRSSVPWFGLDGYSSLVARTGGSIDAPLLTNLNAVEIILDATGSLPLSQITTLTDGRLQITGGSRNFASLTNANGTDLLVSDGGQLSLPAATTYTQSRGDRTTATFRATGAGSVLDLSNLETLTGGNALEVQLAIDAQSGGQVNLRNVAEILDPEQGDTRGRAVRITATGAGSRVDLAALSNFEDRNPNSWVSTGLSSLTANSGGEIVAPLLTDLSAVSINLDGTGVLPVEQFATLKNGQINVSGGDYDFASLIDVSGTTITVSGVDLALPNAANIDGASFLVSGGATLSLPAATTYTQSRGDRTTATFRATGAGSVLDLSNLETLTGGNAIEVQLVIEAQSGGQVNLRNVAEILDPEQGDTRGRAVRITATGAGSRVDLAALSNFEDRDPNSWVSTGLSSLTANSGGEIVAPLLTDLSAVSINLDGTGVLPVEQFATLKNGQINVSGGDYDFASLIDVSGTTITVSGVDLALPNATNIDGASFLVNSGATLSLPAATSYTQSRGDRTTATFRATGAGSVLDLSNLETLTGGNAIEVQLVIEAQSGGQVNLRNVAEILDPEQGDTRGRAVRITATGAGSRVDLAALSNFEDRNPNSWVSTGLSSLTANSGGEILAPLLTDLSAVSINLDGTGVLPVEQFARLKNGQINVSGGDYDFASLSDVSGTTITVSGINLDLGQVKNLSGATVVLNGGEIDLTNAANIDGASFLVSGGATLSLPAATSYTQSRGDRTTATFRATGAGSVLDLSNLETLTGGNAIEVQLVIDAQSGGQVNLRSVAEILDPEQGDTRGRAVRITATGAGSRVDLAALSNFEDRNPNSWVSTGLSSLIANSGGEIHLADSVRFTHVEVVIDPTGSLLVASIDLGTGAVLRGQGDFFGDLVNSGGSVVAGKMPLGLSIQGDYTQTANGRLVLAIDGAVGQNEYSRLSVAGEAQLAGTLEITRLNNFAPDPVDVYPVISAGTISGTFQTIAGATVAGGDITPQYGANVVVLSRNFDSEPFDSFTYQNTVANQRVFFNVTEVLGGPVAFRIYDPAGQLVAYSAATPSNPDDGDFGPFVLSTVGTYDVRVHSASSAPVNFTAALNPAPLVTRPAGFQQSFNGNINVPGATDVWQFDVDSGDEIRLSISEIIGTNQTLSFRLSDPSGRVVARHQVNSQTLDQVTVRPHFAAMGGRYQLTVEGIGDDTAAYRFIIYNSPAPFIVAFSPLGPQRSQISSLQVEFDRAMNRSSFTPEDVIILGPNPVEVGPNQLIPQTSFSINGLTDRLFQIDIDPSLAIEGSYLVTIGPSIVDLAGIPLIDAQQFSFEIDTRGPRVVTTVPSGVVQNHLRFIDVMFDSPIDAATFGIDDIALSGPTGTIGVTQIVELANNTFRIHFPTQTINGGYSLKIGPNIADPAGNLMDQNQNGVQGEVEADVFEQSLSISLPDLVAGAISAEGSLISNSPLTVSWQVSNIGVRSAVGPWSERIYLADSPTGANRQLLATYSFNQTLAPGDSALQRTRSITLPATSFSGNVYFAVEVDSTNNIIESDESNLFVSTQPFAIPATLSLSFPASQVTEGGPPLQGTVTRNGDPSLPLIVSLNSSASDQIVMPATVTIPAGQYSQRFNVSGLVDNIVDGNVSTLIIASSDGFVSASRLLDVIDADRGTLTLSAGVTAITEGESLTVTARRSVVSGQPLLVSLSTTFGSQWTVPASVLIPANEATAQFTIQTVDDLRSEKTETATLTATATGFDPFPFSMQIVDDDLPNLSIQLNRNSILENDTANPIVATVSRETVTGNSVRVRLNSTAPGRLVVPAEVTIPAGELSTRFFITPVDNQIFDTSQSVFVRARGVYDSCGCTITDGFAEASIEVIDATTPSLLLETSQTFVREGVSPAGQITIRRLVASTDQPLTVALSSSNPAKLTLPTSLTIPAGESSAQVAFSTISDRQTTGDEAITVTATAAGLTPANRVITVTDIDLPDLVVTETNWPASGFAGETISIGWTTRNNGQSSATGTWIERVFISSDNAVGDDILVGQYTFTGTLAHQQAYQRVANIELPSIPGDYWLVVQTDATDQVREGLETNNHGISISPIGVSPAYTATVSAALEVAAANTPVLLTGSAVRPDGSPARNEPVSVHLTVRGMKRILPATTDAAGNFEVTFRPLPGEGGTYTIGAAQPGIPDVDAQDSFRLIGMRAEPAEQSVQLIEGAAQSVGSVVIRNLADTPLTGMTVEILGAPANLQVSATLSGDATTLRSAGSLTLNYAASATDASTLSGTFDLRISSLEAPAITVPVNFTVIPLVAQLAANPGSLTKGMLVGGQTAVEFTIRNDGGKETGPLNVLLPTGADWLSLATPATMTSLRPGASTSITLLLTPPADLELTAYNGSLIVRGDDTDVTVPFSFRAVSESSGDLQVTVVDEYFYFTEEKPLVSTATVTLRDPFTGEVVASSNMAAPPSTAEGESAPGVRIDAEGRVTFTGIPSGPYTLEVGSANHESYSNTIRVEAGTLSQRQVFVSRNLVEYIWTVEEVEIEDRTRVTIEAVFETNVPAPVVTMQYREAGESEFKDGVVFDFADLPFIGNSKQIDIKLTNQGWIAAQGVAFDFGSHPFYEIIPLVDEIGTLPAKSEIIVPVILRRIADFSSFGEGEAPVSGIWAEGESARSRLALPCGYAVFVKWYYICGDKVWVSSGIAAINFEVESCPPGTFFPRGGPGRPGRVTPTYVESSTDCVFCVVQKWEVTVGGGLLNKVINKAVGLVNRSGVLKNAKLEVSASGGYENCCPEDGGGSKWYAEGKGSASIEFDYPILGGIIPLNNITSIGGYSVGLDLRGGVFLAGSLAGNLFGKVESECGDLSDYYWYAGLNVEGELRGYVGGGAMIVFSQGDTKYEVEAKLEAGVRGSANAMAQISSNANANRWEVELGKIELYGAVEFNLSHEIAALIGLPFDFGFSYDVSATIYEGEKWPKPIAASRGPEGEGEADDGEIQLESLWDVFDIDSFALDLGFTSLESLAIAIGRPGLDFATVTLDEWPELFADIETVTTPSMDGSGICAEVRLQIEQDAVLTRQGFNASLQIINGLGDPLTAIAADILIRDASGNDVTHLFGIAMPTTTNVEDVTGVGVVSPQTTAVVNWTIVPSSETTGLGSTEYFVSGTLSYLEGIQRITIPLSPTSITVYPQPELDLRYFLQRDVISDDPHTDETEPAEPFTLAVMVQNNGAGDARNLRIESAQPRIIENEKGLLIDFEIVGTKVNGDDVERSLTANFGSIAAGEIGIAQWQMEASLQGLFTEYNATFEHVSPFGDNRFSLIKSVAIHELIRVVDATQVDGDDGLPDFLVNDLPDPNDFPDTLYLSDGSVMEVGRGDNVVVSSAPTLQNLRIGVTADMIDGWSYLRMDDPSLGDFILIGVERSDGTILPSQNFWQTDRTFIGSGQRPVIEDRIHLLDYNSTGSYTFIFSNGDLIGPEVKTFAGVLPNPTTQAIDAIDITFTEALRAATFTASAVQLTKNGGLVDLTGVAIDRLTDSTYRIRGLLPFTADDAIYELSVDAREVTDVVGNAGTERESYRWVKGESVPTILQVEGLPQVLSRSGVDWIDLVMSKPIDLASLTISDLSLSRNSVELLDSEVTITQVGDTTYRIGNLGRLTGIDGEYRFVFDAATIQDTSGAAGLGDVVAQWTLDTTAPQLVAVVPPATNPRNIVVQRIDIEFSEPIDINSLDVSDLALIRDGGSENLLAGDSRIFFEHRFDNVYRIHGLNWVQGFIADPQVATFTFTVDGTGVSDPAGNFGSGVLSASWTIDLDRPEPPMDLVLSTASGPVLNGRVNSFDARLSGLLAESGLTVAIRDMRAGSDLLRAFVSGTEFDLPIRFSSTGQQQLRIRVIDPAGNTTDTFMDNLFVTSEPPLIQSITGPPSAAIRESFDSIDVIFTKPIDTQSLTPQSLSLTVNDQELIDSEVTITPVDQRTYRIGNLRRLMVTDGNYVLSLDTSQIQDLAGNQGTETITTPWTFDSTPPTSTVNAFPATVTASHFNVSWAGTDGGSGSGVQSYSIYVSTDAGPFELWLEGTQDSSALFEGRPGRSYAFYSVATDGVGNQESKMPLVEASTSVFVSTAWQNPFNQHDVDDNRVVEPLDALLVLIEVARGRQQDVRIFPKEFQSPYHDTNGDARIEPLDALLILNFLSVRNRDGEGEFISTNASGMIAPTINRDNVREMPQHSAHDEAILWSFHKQADTLEFAEPNGRKSPINGLLLSAHNEPDGKESEQDSHFELTDDLLIDITNAWN